MHSHPTSPLRPVRRLASVPLAVVLSIVSMAAILGAQEDPGGSPPKAPPSLPSSVTPAPRTEEWAVARQAEVLRRARDSAERADVVFVGDSITQGWESAGNRAWARDIAPLGRVLNLGVGGDRTEHVLWRLNQAPLAELKPRVVVLMIGTNNLGHQSATPAETAMGVRSVIDLLAAQCPEATIMVLGIFPRGKVMNTMRGDACQINQAIETHARRHPSGRVEFRDIGSLFVEADGTIREAIMPDSLHLSPDGYALWASAITPRLKELLAAPVGSQGQARP